jgi:hypothetical protein|eukprot:evm.model.NODE_39318_length_7956_cov_21.271494.1
MLGADGPSVFRGTEPAKKEGENGDVVSEKLGLGLDGAHEGEAGGRIGDLIVGAGDALTKLYCSHLEGGQIVLPASLDGMDEILQGGCWRRLGISHDCGFWNV